MDTKTVSELRAMMLANDAIEADDAIEELCRRAEVTEAAAAVPPQPEHPTAIVARTLFSCAAQARFFGMRPIL